MSTERLDRALVSRGLVFSRSRAAELIASGDVLVDGRAVTRAATKIRAHQRLGVADDLWVSRGAHKLLGALEACPDLRVQGSRCLDAGASTGGFTQVLLSRGAAQVVAVDVGHDQLAAPLRSHPQVENHEGLNLRHLGADTLGAPFDLIVADLSFISLRLVAAPLAGQAAPGADLLLMVKPQFEVGRDRLGRAGVVTSASQRREAVASVAAAGEAAGSAVVSVHRSPRAGQHGNAEYFLRLRAPTETAPHSARQTAPQTAGMRGVPPAGTTVPVEGIPLSPAAADRVVEAHYHD